jgi:hypothetical protein
MRLQPWVKLPTSWIQSTGLKQFVWKQGEGSDSVAALLLLFPLAHFTSPDSGEIKLTYDDLNRATALSRTKISSGLTLLEKADVLIRETKHQSRYRLLGYGEEGVPWAKLPAKNLYLSNGELTFRQSMFMRNRAELDALKIYLALVARRDNDKNAVYLSYEKITEYTGVHRNRIKAATSFLAGNGLISMENIKSQVTDLGSALIYRVTHVDPYKNMGTQST